jgi:hypothetical protein
VAFRPQLYLSLPIPCNCCVGGLPVKQSPARRGQSKLLTPIAFETLMQQWQASCTTPDANQNLLRRNGSVSTKNIPLPSTGSISGGNDSWQPSLAGRREAGSGRSWQVAALLVMPPSRRVLFRQVLNELGVSVYCVESCRSARKLLQLPGSLGLIVTHVTLPDGNWCDVLRMMTDYGVPASVVVDTTEVNQTLWSEVFWRGAYDLLIQPCDWNDVCQCFEGALRSRPVASRLASRSAA